MKFEDLTNQQLKKILSIYKYNLLEPIKGYGKEKRNRLIELCTALLIIDDEKIKPKVIEPIKFDIPPKPTRRRNVVEKPEKKEIEKPEKKIDNQVYIYKNRKSQEIIELDDVKIPQKEFNLIKKNKKIIIKNPEITFIKTENFRLINRNFEFRLSNGMFDYKKNPNTKKTTILLFSFSIIDNKILLNGWADITENNNGDCYIELLNGYKGGGANIIDYMKKYVGDKNYFYLSSLETRATVDFYRKMGLERVKENLDKTIKRILSPRQKKEFKDIINKATDYDELYDHFNEELFTRGSTFYYFPNKKVQEDRYEKTPFELIPSGREWIIAIVKEVLNMDEKEGSSFVDNLIKKTIKAKGKLEGTGRFLD